MERFVSIAATTARVPTNGLGGNSTTVKNSDLIDFANPSFTTGIWRFNSRQFDAPGVGQIRHGGTPPDKVFVSGGTGATVGIYTIERILGPNSVILSGAVAAGDLSTGDIAGYAVKFKEFRLTGITVWKADSSASDITLTDHAGTALSIGVAGVISVAAAAAQINPLPIPLSFDGEGCGFFENGLTVATSSANTNFTLFYEL